MLATTKGPLGMKWQNHIKQIKSDTIRNQQFLMTIGIKSCIHHVSCIQDLSNPEKFAQNARA